MTGGMGLVMTTLQTKRTLRQERSRGEGEREYLACDFPVRFSCRAKRNERSGRKFGAEVCGPKAENDPRGHTRERGISRNRVGVSVGGQRCFNIVTATVSIFRFKNLPLL